MVNVMSPASQNLQGLVQAVNKGGIKVNERWFNYPRPYTGTKLTPEVIGMLVVFSFMDVEGKAYLKSLAVTTPVAAAPAAATAGQVRAAVPAPADLPEAPEVVAETASQEPAPAAAPTVSARLASERQLEEIARVSDLAGVTYPQLSLIVKMRFGDERKSLKSLSTEEASRLIYFLGGSLPRKSFGRDRS